MPHHPPLPKAPQPTREIFDPYNSTSTGHQYVAALLAGSTSWRDSRTYKLAHQFRDSSGRGGSQHLSDLVGAGSVNWTKDGRKANGHWENGAPGLREIGWQDIRPMLSGSRKRAGEEVDDNEAVLKKRCTGEEVYVDTTDRDKPSLDTVSPPSASDQCDIIPAAVAKTLPSPSAESPQIFRGLTMYLNGSTAPEVSDHKLKQMFMQHGGNSSIALGRRTVTHVILGKTCGGGLASGKIHKEVATKGGKGIKYVTAQWVLDSVEKGIRQAEGPYIPPEIARRIGGSGQSSVRTMFTVKALSKKNG